MEDEPALDCCRWGVLLLTLRIQARQQPRGPKGRGSARQVASRDHHHRKEGQAGCGAERKQVANQARQVKTVVLNYVRHCVLRRRALVALAF